MGRAHRERADAEWAKSLEPARQKKRQRNFYSWTSKEWRRANPISHATLDPGLLAPTIGWLSHESCQIIGESLVAIAGRVARAVMAETPGLPRSSWTMEDVAENNLIRDTSKPVIFPVMPTGHDHIAYGFASANARSNEASASQQVDHV
jgi:hypothetical protein